MRLRQVIGTAAGLLLTTTALAQSAAPQRDSIRADKLRADLMFLAGDGFRGRLVNTPENALALDWVKARFAALGLKPMGRGPGGDDYVQPNMIATSSLGASNRLEVDWGSGRSVPQLGPDFHPLGFSASAKVEAPLVFAGFGIHAPDRGHDDYRGDVRGKIVLILMNEPGASDPASPFDGVVNSEYQVPIRKAMAAQAQGAAGVLFVTDVHNRTDPEDFAATTRAYWPQPAARIQRYFLGRYLDRLHIPSAQISAALADKLLAGTGQSLLTLARAAERPQPVRALPGVRVAMDFSVDRQLIADRNILGGIEGSDPAVKDEWVILSAHVDHEGADGTQIYNGADDDGSGTVALLAMAEAYTRAAAEGKRPRRSVMFAAFNSEERGPLLGAWGYTEAPVVPLDKTIAVLNMDMIGRNEEVPVGGGAKFRGYQVQSAESNRNSFNLIGWSRSPTIAAAFARANQGADAFTIKQQYDNITSNILRRSDHWPFIQRRVPAVWIHTGLHPDYHTIYDRPEKIEYDKMARLVRLIYQVSWDLADAAR